MLATVTLLLVWVVGALLQQPPADYNEMGSSLPSLSSPQIAQLGLSLNGSTSNTWEFHCNSTMFGSNLNSNSCLQAYRGINTSPDQLIYRERVDPQPSDRRLPMMILSGMCLRYWI